MQSFSAVGDFLSNVSSNVSSYLPARGSNNEDVSLSDHDFGEFGDLLEMNDKISMELAEGLSEADAKKYELEPPRVIVVGLTSAGKSSLLERVIGHPIFPVRDNVCTRRPFRVQLKKDKQTNTANATPLEQKENEAGNVSDNVEQGTASLRFLSGNNRDQVYKLPSALNDVRDAIEREQKSASDDVAFSSDEITAEISSQDNQTFTFTDLPGIFLVSERKMGDNYAQSRQRNEALMKQTVDIMKKYLQQNNTIVLAVVSATDWMHGLNNDPFISYLAEWLERIRTEEKREVPVYGVITKLDMQQETGLSDNSPVKKVLLGQLPSDHILNGLRVRKWIPVISSKEVLKHGIQPKGAMLEQQGVRGTLAKSKMPSNIIDSIPIGRSALLRELKQALLQSINKSYGTMQRGVDDFAMAVEDKLNNLPQVAEPSEKRRIFDGGLKKLEDALSDLVGPRGRHLATQKGERSLRMRLMVDTPKDFDNNLTNIELRGDLVNEVTQIMNQAALEQGGSFDSDVSFTTLSQKIIERFTQPCLALVNRASAVIAEALRIAVQQAFGEYTKLEAHILHELGVPQQSMEGSVSSSSGSGGRGNGGQIGTTTSESRRVASVCSQGRGVLVELTAERPGVKLFPLLTESARHKVLNLLDAFGMMDCFHPMWRNFDQLYRDILLAKGNDNRSSGSDVRNRAESSLQDMLQLPLLAEKARKEGEMAIQTYEKETNERLSPANKEKIAKHFARVEVMGYIVRMSLMSSVFPIVLRDIRDGLFRGITVGMAKVDHSVAQLLRNRLVFNAKMELVVFDMMEPSADDVKQRNILLHKRESLRRLKQDFDSCQSKLDRLSHLLDC